MKKYNLILWGAGENTRKCLEKGYLKEHNILGIIDSFKDIKTFHSIPVYKPNALNDLIKKADYLLIFPQKYDAILAECFKCALDWNKIVIANNTKTDKILNFYYNLKEISLDFYNNLSGENFQLTSPNLSDIVDNTRLIGRDKYSANEKPWDYMPDYFRFRTFEFCAREIKTRNIEGALAELGVFRGAFASLINETFPDRKLYLFDTFESFDEEEYKSEQAKNYVPEGEGFRLAHAQTSEELVLNNLPYRKNCIIYKGLFPNSISGGGGVENEKFAFVSLDVDLEESTYQGLKFFYPRLSENGYIFLHDYTVRWLQGVKAAVKRYEEENNIFLKKVPIADRGGTLIITK